MEVALRYGTSDKKLQDFVLKTSKATGVLQIPK